MDTEWRGAIDGLRQGMLQGFARIEHCFELKWSRCHPRPPHSRAPHMRALRQMRWIAGCPELGDCLSYGTAAALDEPLLFTGSDFAQTDITAAG